MRWIILCWGDVTFDGNSERAAQSKGTICATFKKVIDSRKLSTNMQLERESQMVSSMCKYSIIATKAT